MCDVHVHVYVNRHIMRLHHRAPNRTLNLMNKSANDIHQVSWNIIIKRNDCVHLSSSFMCACAHLHVYGWLCICVTEIRQRVDSNAQH